MPLQTRRQICCISLPWNGLYNRYLLRPQTAHFVDDTPKRPHVSPIVVRHEIPDLGTRVEGGSNLRLRHVILNDLGHVKISQLHSTILAQQDICRLYWQLLSTFRSRCTMWLSCNAFNACVIWINMFQIVDSWKNVLLSRCCLIRYSKSPASACSIITLSQSSVSTIAPDVPRRRSIPYMQLCLDAWPKQWCEPRSVRSLVPSPTGMGCSPTIMAEQTTFFIAYIFLSHFRRTL
jgi:hypothetical protein